MSIGDYGSARWHGKADGCALLGLLCEFSFIVFVSGRFWGCEVGASHTPKSAHFTALLGSQVLKRPMGVSGCNPGHSKAGVYAFFG